MTTEIKESTFGSGFIDVKKFGMTKTKSILIVLVNAREVSRALWGELQRLLCIS